jgi:uroporphyrinogen-III synthase
LTHVAPRAYRLLVAQPLAGKTVVLLRAKGQGGALAADLRELGASILEVPIIAIAPPSDMGPLRAAMGHLDAFDWIAFTSPNAVAAFTEACEHPVKARVASVGPGTSARAREAGLEVALEASESVQEGLARALAESGVRGKKVLIPRSEIARDALERALEAAGAEVTAVTAYRTVEGDADVSPLIEALDAGSVDAICFTSASTASNLGRRIGAGELARRFSGARPVAASMGPIASKELRELGVTRIVEAAEHTARGLVLAVVKALEGS